jgi:hypothetical protein
MLLRSRRWRRSYDDQLERHYSWTPSCMYYHRARAQRYVTKRLLYRACTRIAYTVSTFTAETGTPTNHQQYNLSRKLIFLVLILEAERLGSNSRPCITLAKSVQVDLGKLPTLATWKRDYTMETILLELRRSVFPSQTHIGDLLNIGFAGSWPYLSTKSSLNPQRALPSKIRDVYGNYEGYGCIMNKWLVIFFFVSIMRFMHFGH